MRRSAKVRSGRLLSTLNRQSNMWEARAHHLSGQFRHARRGIGKRA